MLLIKLEAKTENYSYFVHIARFVDNLRHKALYFKTML